MPVWLSVWSEVQIVCIWSSWCHCHPQTPSSLASLKSRLVLPFWYRLTQVVLEKRLLNGWSYSCRVVVWCERCCRVSVCRNGRWAVLLVCCSDTRSACWSPACSCCSACGLAESPSPSDQSVICRRLNCFVQWWFNARTGAGGGTGPSKSWLCPQI